MSWYDKEYILEVLHTIEEYQQRMMRYPEFVREWFNEIFRFCQMSLNQNEPHEMYENTAEGEILTCMIWQYRFDDLFERRGLNKRLCMLADQRDSVIQNHQDQNHQNHP